MKSCQFELQVEAISGFGRGDSFGRHKELLPTQSSQSVHIFLMSRAGNERICVSCVGRRMMGVAVPGSPGPRAGLLTVSLSSLSFSLRCDC